MWVDREVLATWRKFIEAMHRNAGEWPTDVVELMVKLDHAILTEMLQGRGQRRKAS